MGYAGTILLVLTCASINFGQGHTTCDLTDTPCTTKGAQKLLSEVVKGFDGFFEPLDPLNVPDVDSKSLDLEYKKTNSTIKGISNCVFKLLKMNPKDSTTHSEILCPKLNLKYYYEAKGVLGPIQVDGTGIAHMNLNDYFITVDGGYKFFTSEKDNKLHITFFIYKPTFEPKGPVSIDIDGQLHSDPVKDVHAKEYVTKTGLDDMEKIVRTIHMPEYLELVMKAINIYLNEVPYDEIFQL